ncbi:MAG: N-acetylmuramic acid 6-phosphate etherase, partial [Verrucomicrobiota bacterium]|nr:N-acetylmuramic acid 6-phosphate etherase [Verrucomicrobiota bacterium]
VLGFEGGGTKSEWALLGTDGRIIEEGILPAANLRLISPTALLQMFSALPREVSHVGVFLAGCSDETDRETLRLLAERTWPQARVTVGSDRDSGFATAFRERDGIIVNAGTGSAVTGRVGARVEKAGGWGQLLGDKGGGYNLAVQALRLVLSNYDQDHEVDELGQNILRQLCLNRLEGLVNWATKADKMSVAKLAPVVFAAARNGHAEMQRAIEDGARVLARFACAVAKRLGLAAPEVKLLGGLFRHHGEYAKLFVEYLSEILPGARVSVCTESGALGAAWLAARGLPALPQTAVSNDSLDLSGLVTEQRNPRSANLDKLSTGELVDLFVREENSVINALTAAREPLVRAIELVGAALKNGGRLFYVGAGTSGRLGVLDASEIPPTFGASPELVQGLIAGGATALHSAVEGAEDQAAAGALAIIERGVTSADVVCGISASGRTPYVLGALSRAREIGAKSIFLTCNQNSEAECDLEISLPTGPEIVTGSTRLKAGTATKLALNIISTCAMIRLGKVHENLMVDVRATNQKLRGRAIRLVRQLRNCSYEDARDALEKRNWNVRAALADLGSARL